MGDATTTLTDAEPVKDHDPDQRFHIGHMAGLAEYLAQSIKPQFSSFVVLFWFRSSTAARCCAERCTEGKCQFKN
ncbi:hypothetical protein A6P08_04800 [Acidithiobacillus thiooxidans]|nr:hypothetical protein A6P08_04800 [Acidithiobacillus thiooxidans]